jgi:hypothetical protein
MTRASNNCAVLLGLGLLMFCAPLALATEPATPKTSESATVSAPQETVTPATDSTSAQAQGRTSSQPDFERYIVPTIDTDLDLGLCDGS